MSFCQTGKYTGIEKNGIYTLYSICVYGKASHMRDFPHRVKFMLECHIFGVRKM